MELYVKTPENIWNEADIILGGIVINGKNIVIREYRPEELETGLGVRNNIFPPVTLESWRRGEPQTAVIAFDVQDTVGFIPLALRQFKLAPGITIPVAFENAVGVKQEYRGLGIGTSMIEEAGRFLRGRADALLVYREDEGSKGYRFYKKTGHADLAYIRCFTCSSSAMSFYSDVDVSRGAEGVLKVCSSFQPAFEDTYSEYGGFLVRSAKNWERAVKKLAIAALPVKFYCFCINEYNSTLAYIIAGERIRPNRQNAEKRLEVLEIAARDCDKKLIKVLLQSVCAFSLNEGYSALDVFITDFHPFLPILTDLNFKPSPRSMQIMGLIPDPASFYEHTWMMKANLQGVEIKISTPTRNFMLPIMQAADFNGVKTEITVEMKDETLQAWLMGRVDMRSRLNEGSVTVINGNEEFVDKFAKLIPLNKWQYHHMDFI